MCHNKVPNIDIHSNKKKFINIFFHTTFFRTNHFILLVYHFNFMETISIPTKVSTEILPFYFIFYHRGDFSYFPRYRSSFNFLLLPHPCPSINSYISTGSYHLSPVSQVSWSYIKSNIILQTVP